LIDQWNPADGILTEVTLEMETCGHQDFALDSEDNIAQDVSVTSTGMTQTTMPFGGIVDLELQEQITTYSVSADTDAAPDFAGTDWFAFEQADCMSDTILYTLPAQIAFYSGTGQVNHPTFATGAATVDGPGNYAYYVNTQLGTEICAYYEYVVPLPEVTKTAIPEYSVTYDWDCWKDVDPATHALFDGESATSSYDVTCERSMVEGDYAVTGVITITNPSATVPITVTDIDDVIGGGATAIGDVSLVCDGPLPAVIDPLATFECDYEATLTDMDDGTNTVTVVTPGGEVDYDEAFSWVGVEPTVFGDASITVVDTNGGSWLFEDSGSVTYQQDFDCEDIAWGESTHENYMHENCIYTVGDAYPEFWDCENVEVDCYKLAVEKDGEAGFETTYTWEITKEADQTELELGIGETAMVNYNVCVDRTMSGTTDNYAEGAIYITNPAPMAAELTDVTDMVGSTVATVYCPDMIVPAGNSVTCWYDADIPDVEGDVLNTAEVTQQLYNYPYDSAPVMDGTAAYSAEFLIPVSFDEIDECVEVNDDQFGYLGTTCEDTACFTYQKEIGPYEVCEDYTFDNCATSTTNDMGLTDTACWHLDIIVPCDMFGCTPGFWKNHPLSWPEGIEPTDTVGEYFPCVSEALAGDTLMDALNYGGNGQYGKEKNLLRIATASLLNSMTWDFPYSTAEITDAVCSCYDGGFDKNCGSTLQSDLDYWNNELPCPECGGNDFCPDWFPEVTEPDDGLFFIQLS
jgi:hypothetical protein